MAIKFTTDAPSGYLSNSKLEEIPSSFTILPVYPNPFNSNFKINERSSIKLRNGHTYDNPRFGGSSKYGR